ncbi:MAG: glycosyltransferase family 8 protein [Lachnospiraceae bacterium]|nr:glycosyltransferase family 8 protein [Lachnospiraceae bacterium]
MNVMYAADDNYAEIASVSIASLLENNKDADEITIYFVEDNIASENKEKLHKTAGKYQRAMVFIPKPDIRSKVQTELKTLRWSDSSFSRLYLDDVLKEHPGVEKILYLDCDTLVLSPLKELWEEDIDGYLGAAVLECMGNAHKKIIGALPQDNYINSGVMLINARKWIEEKVSAKATEFIRRHGGKIEYVDQGVINGTISNKMKIISPRYNLTSLAWDFSYEEMQVYRKPEFGYSKKEWEEALNAPSIIHFTTSFLSIRPWHEGSKHFYADCWKKYHGLSGWGEFKPRKLGGRFKRDFLEKGYKLLPNGLAARIAGFFHAHVKPALFKIR